MADTIHITFNLSMHITEVYFKVVQDLPTDIFQMQHPFILIDNDIYRLSWYSTVLSVTDGKSIFLPVNV